MKKVISALRVLKIVNKTKLSRNLKLLNFKNNICWENYAKAPCDIFFNVSDFNILLKKIIIPESIRYAQYGVLKKAEPMM